MAAATPFHLTVTNVRGALFDGEAILLSVPGSEGVMTVLAHHEPLIALLTKGNARIIRPDNTETNLSLTHGVLEIHANHVTVLV